VGGVCRRIWLARHRVAQLYRSIGCLFKQNPLSNTDTSRSAHSEILSDVLASVTVCLHPLRRREVLGVGNLGSGRRSSRAGDEAAGTLAAVLME
jgi:hypothetical protein